MSRELRTARIAGDIAILPLTKGFSAVIDASDLPLVDGYNWSALVSPRRRAIYACRVERRDGSQKMLLMHRVILGLSDVAQADHIDGDGLNNRRSNLRQCSHAQNQINKSVRNDNTSGLKGISLDKRISRWKAEIMLSGRRRFLGHFSTPEEAHAAYAAAAIELHGEFARLK